MVDTLIKHTFMDTINNLVTGDNARVAGCNGERNAAKYLEGVFKNFGYKTEIKEFPLNRPASMGVGYININDECIIAKSFNGGAQIPNTLSGEIINVGLGTKEEIDAIGSLKGKIALVQRGTNTIIDKATNCYNANAEAIIVFNNTDGIITSALGENVPLVPVLSISRENGEKIVNMLQSGQSITLTSNNFDIDIEYDINAKSCNVIAELPATVVTEDTKTILVGAHFDSVSCPGANDNASGVAVVVELARLFSDSDMQSKLKHNLTFVAFGSEELGLLGSEAFVRDLKETETTDSIKAMIALDMVGVGDKIDVLNVNAELSNVMTDLAVKYINENNFLVGRCDNGMNSSDHAHFELVGIPSCVIETSPAGDYHTESDTIDRISEENLANVTKVVTDMIFDLQ